MEKVIRIMNRIAAICVGVTLSSLLITESENWKYSLPICLLCITLSNTLKKNIEKLKRRNFTTTR